VLNLILLIIPLFIAISSVWIDWLISSEIKGISAFLVSNKDVLVSLFGVLAGAYLTLYATYALKKNEDIKKDIAAKQIAFYEPILKELKSALIIKEQNKIWQFELSEYRNYRRVS